MCRVERAQSVEDHLIVGGARAFDDVDDECER
jgi:hypothetical protein